MEKIVASAPGRVCLFGEHQDYLGLPVIAGAISLRIWGEATERPGTGIEVHLPDIGGEVALDPNVPQHYESRRDYLRSCLSVLQRRGLTWRRGWRVVIHGDIPICAGVSSSSALVVMWLRLLMGLSDQQPDVQPEELARLGHAAEVLEFDEPGGMMDHFCAALGGVLFVNTIPPFSAERLNVALDGIVLGDSHQPKATLETLRRIRSDVEEGIAQMRRYLPGFDLRSTPLSEAELYLDHLTPLARKRLYANLINRQLTQEAAAELRAGRTSALGRLLTSHHEQLRDGLDLSTPKIEAMLKAAMAAGAAGGKINGSGGGGCMFVHAPGMADAAAGAMERAGGKAYRVRIDEGARLERITL